MLIMSKEFHLIIKTNVILIDLCCESCTLVLHSWPVFVRCYLTVEFDTMPCFLSLSKWMRKETIMRATWLCVHVCVCEAVRVRAIKISSNSPFIYDTQLCQHSPSVFLSTLIHTIWMMSYTGKNVSFTSTALLLSFFSVNIISCFHEIAWFADDHMTLKPV